MTFAFLGVLHHSVGVSVRTGLRPWVRRRARTF